MLEKLPPRERQVFQTLYAKGSASAAELCASMDDPPSNSAMRIMLTRLERKGFVTRFRDQQKYIYSPAVPDLTVKQTAIRNFVDTFFRGSPIGAAAALIGMSERLRPEELVEIEQAIAKAREEDDK